MSICVGGDLAECDSADMSTGEAVLRERAKPQRGN
jgi:hypothetical protein